MDLLDMSLKEAKQYALRRHGPITEIKHGLRIAVIKDSFGNAMIPIFLPHSQEIFISIPSNLINNNVV